MADGYEKRLKAAQAKLLDELEEYGNVRAESVYVLSRAFPEGRAVRDLELFVVAEHKRLGLKGEPFVGEAL